MPWPKGQPRNKAKEVQPEMVEQMPSGDMYEWISSMEEQAQKAGCVLVAASHHEAEEGAIHAGKYAGIRLLKGKCKAQLNNGEWIE